MDKIKKALSNLSPEHIKPLYKILDISSTSANKSTLLNKLCSFSGIDLILASLSEKELLLFAQVCKYPEGATYSLLEKNLHYKIEKIEEIALSLKNKLLVYILKNRKHLTNKLDKIYIFNPLFELLNLSQKNNIQNLLEKNFNYICKNVENTKKNIQISDPHKILSEIFNNQGIITLNSLKNICPKKNFNDIIKNYLGKKYISIFHYLYYPYHTYIILDEKILLHFILKKNNKTVPIKANNKYLLLNNLLKTYDIISSYGLYLTQQNEFRKIDKKRINDIISPLYNLDGRKLSRDETTHFCLFIYKMLDLISIEKSSIFVSLKALEKNLYSPNVILKNIFNKYKKTDSKDNIFNPPFNVPDKKSIKCMLDIFSKKSSINISALPVLFFMKKIFDCEKIIINRLPENRKNILENFEDTLRFLIITGIINIVEKNYILSKIGKEIFNSNYNPVDTNTTSRIDKNNKIYVNSDFSLIVPKENMDSRILYLINAYTDTIKDDVMLHLKISKDSILAAYKRGMETENFLKILEENSQNKVPQNLAFLLNDWVKQTLTLSIKNTTIIKTNHPAYIDQLVHILPNYKAIERISDNYAIINREYLDEIIKNAKKHNAIISIIQDMEDD